MLLSLASLLFLGQAHLFPVPTPEPQAQTQTTVVVAPSTQPTTQPAQAVITTPAPGNAQPSNILDTFSKTRLFQLAEGKQTTSLHDMLQPDFWIDTIKELVVAALGFIPRLLVSLLFLVIFWGIYRAVRKMLLSAMKSANVDASIRDLLLTISKWVVMGFGVVIACNQIGIPIVAMLTGVSILGLAVGFAAQETLANFIAGVVIFWDKPFRVGDLVSVDGITGQVQRVTFRSCRILNGNGETLVFPNTFMLAHKVANHTTHPVSRVSIAVGVSYKASIDVVRKTMLALVVGDTRIRVEPKPEVVVDKLADSSVDLLFRFWVDDEKLEGRLRFEYTEKVKNALDAQGIEIPYPHRQLVIENAPAVEHKLRQAS